MKAGQYTNSAANGLNAFQFHICIASLLLQAHAIAEPHDSLEVK